MLATIGRAAAVGRVGHVELTGLPAWLAWLGVHIAFLTGFRNRVAVLLEWAWSYATFTREARVITETAEQRRFEHELRRPPPPGDAAPGVPVRGDDDFTRKTRPDDTKGITEGRPW